MAHIIIAKHGQFNSRYRDPVFTAFMGTGIATVSMITLSERCDDRIPCVILRRDSNEIICEVLKFSIPSNTAKITNPDPNLTFRVESPTDEYALVIGYTETREMHHALMLRPLTLKTGADLQVYLSLS